ncbi:MAG: methylated-DNA--[protein]-cysteine S-methyltransferase [Caulobacterales bacterium]
MPDTRPERLTIDRIASPIGELLIAVDEAGVLRALDLWGDEAGTRRLLTRQYGATPAAWGPAPNSIHGAFERYFAGDIGALKDVPWRAVGTPFQLSVWRALTTIPPGETRSYGALAAQLGMPKAMRAVGLANGSNPIAIVVPCHRVIGADGSLTGFGGGLPRKRWLLRHEGAAFRENRGGKRTSGGLQAELQFG